MERLHDAQPRREDEFDSASHTRAIVSEFRETAYIREAVDQNNGRFCGGLCGGLIDVMISKAIHSDIGMVERVWIQWIHEDPNFEVEFLLIECRLLKLELVQSWK